MTFMSKRRKRPAPPLVLKPVFGRFPVGSSREARLIELARFLEGRNCLTDGGSKSLAEGLRGRNQVVSLGLQDVRSYAHGLVSQLIDQPAEEWAGSTTVYFETYDKGKPRRPTHLQRLYLEWSRDFSWPGLLEACGDHPHLWEEISRALQRIDDNSLDKDMLSLALNCRDRWTPWKAAFGKDSSRRRELLILLPYISILSQRICWLADTARTMTGREAWSREMILACHGSFLEARQLGSLEFCRESLERVALANLDQELFDPVFVSAFRSFVQNRATIERLMEAIRDDDPIRRVVFGPRPGVSWLGAQKEEMLRLIELR